MTENPFSTQGWNRYSYVGNSPVNFTDPSGYCFMGCFWQPVFRAIGNFFRQNWRAILQIAITAACNMTPLAGPGCAAIGSFVVGLTSGNLGQALRGAAIAFVTATAFDLVGTATLGPGHPIPDFLSPKHLANIAGHALVGCASAVAQGGRCGPGALAAAAGSLAGPAIGHAFPNARTNPAHLFGGTFASAVVGGVASVAGGGNFANGAVTAAFGYLFNQLAPTISPEQMTHVLDRHGAWGSKWEETAGQFTPQFSTPDKILGLIEGAWRSSTPDEFRAGPWDETAELVGAVFLVDPRTGVKTPYIIGKSGKFGSDPGTPTHVYVIRMNSDLQIQTMLPVHPSRWLYRKNP